MCAASTVPALPTQGAVLNARTLIVMWARIDERSTGKGAICMLGRGSGPEAHRVHRQPFHGPGFVSPLFVSPGFVSLSTASGIVTPGRRAPRLPLRRPCSARGRPTGAPHICHIHAPLHAFPPCSPLNEWFYGIGLPCPCGRKLHVSTRTLLGLEAATTGEPPLLTRCVPSPIS